MSQEISQRFQQVKQAARRALTLRYQHHQQRFARLSRYHRTTNRFYSGRKRAGPPAHGPARPEVRPSATKQSPAFKLSPQTCERWPNYLRPWEKTLEEKQRDNGLMLRKVSVPLGVVGVIYEARPNVTFDVFALCLKAGNVSVTQGRQRCRVLKRRHRIDHPPSAAAVRTRRTPSVPDARFARSYSGDVGGGRNHRRYHSPR